MTENVLDNYLKQWEGRGCIPALSFLIQKVDIAAKDRRLIEKHRQEAF